MTTTITIVTYPGSLSSAVYGWQEMFILAQRICMQKNPSVRFEIQIINAAENGNILPEIKGDVVLLPPAMEKHFYRNPSQKLLEWLKTMHEKGAVIGSACAGAFLIASAGLLDNQTATVHWSHAEEFASRFSKVRVDADRILIKSGSIITAGGMMSWIDLGLELVSCFAGLSVMRELGKKLVIDTGTRQQKYYSQFIPVFNHGDRSILKIQRFIELNYRQNIRIPELAAHTHLTERTFLRRFFKATGLKPLEYLQKLRVQKACELLEETSDTFEQIALLTGYEDISACRKIFKRKTGLTPGEFRKRFR